jgi:oligosaccharide repeat unit polymerase
VNTLLFFIATVVAVIYLIRKQPADRRTIFEPGVLTLALFSLCYLLPAVVAIVVGVDLVPAENLRAAVEVLSEYGLVFVVSFAFFYTATTALFSRFRITPRSSRKRLYPKPISCLVAAASILAVTKLILLAYGVGGGEYGEQYVVRMSMPAAISQGLNVMQGLQMMLILMFAAYGFNAYPSRKWKLLATFTVAVYLADMFFTHSRSNFVMLLLVLVAAYSFHGRPIGIKKEIAFAVLFILVLNAFAFLRVTESGSAPIEAATVLVPSEFLFIFRNAVHLSAVVGTPDFVAPPGTSYLQGLVSFIPKQINPGKWDLSGWYLEAYFPGAAESGSGLAFGIIPEAIVNFGLLSMFLQALLLAVVLNGIRVFAEKARWSGPNIWIVIYLYSFAAIYHLVRTESFALVGGFVLGFVVPYFVVRGVRKVTSLQI